jgi:C1A family cysteine protease
MRKIAGYGWRPSHPDIRDHRFAVPAQMALPRHRLLIAGCPPIWDQGQQGSCTAHGIGRAYWFDRHKQGEPDFMPARAFIYFNERTIEGTPQEDSGASVRDGIQAIAQYGVPPETLCPYDPRNILTSPPAASVYTEAANHKAINYQALNSDLYSLKACLASGYVFVFGFTVYENFESTEVSNTGLMSMPQGKAIGGHCVCCVGYNSNNYFCCANSWGTNWGDPDFPGHFWMPPEYISNEDLAADFWVVQGVAA